MAHWVGAVGLLVGLVLVLVLGERAVVPGSMAPGNTMAIYGYEVEAVNAAGGLETGAVVTFLIFGAILLALMAMVLRNVYLILKGSEGSTPFQKDNVRMVREIGYFLIAQPVVGLVAEVVTRLVSSAEVEISVNLAGVIIGLVVLCLSHVFARGMELESDMDGLL